jgi:hypothetical protein
MRIESKTARRWGERIGPKATHLLALRVRATYIALGSVVVVLAINAVPWLWWADVPAGLNIATTVIAVILIIGGMAIPKFLTNRWKQRACVEALNYLRATTHSTLKHLPYATMQSPRGF